MTSYDLLHSGLNYDWLHLVRVTLRQAVYRQSVPLGDKSLRLTTSNFIFQLNTCGYSPYVTSSLTRGWVCRLQLLLVLTSAVIFRSKSRETHDPILLSQIRHSPNLEGQVPVLITPRDRLTSFWVLYYVRRSVGQSVLEWSTHLGLTTILWHVNTLLGYATRF
jgi:hypothetical protein